MRVRSVALGTITAVALLGAACGGSSSVSSVSSTTLQPTISSPSTTGMPSTTVTVSSSESGDGWSGDHIGDRPADSQSVALATGSGAIVMAEQEVGVGAWFGDGTGFRSAEAPVSGAELPMFAAGVIEVSGGYLAVVNDIESFVPHVWHSADGRSWAVNPSIGLDQPADISAMASVGDNVVIAGALRTGDDPSRGPFTAVLWHSDDLESWTSVSLPETTAEEESFVQDVVATTDGFLALGSVGGHATAWRSDDGGETWVSTAVGAGSKGGSGLNQLASDGMTMVAVAHRPGIDDPPGVGGAVSSDDGRTWQPWLIDGEAAEGLGWPRVDHADDFFWLAATRSHHAFSNLDSCYVDVRLCQTSEPVLFRSPDGATWTEVDLGPADLPSGSGVDTVIDLAGGIALVGSAAELFVWSGPPGADLPARAPRQPLAPPEFELVEWEDDLEIGVTYRYPLYVHCGMGSLGGFNGRSWHYQQGEGVESDGEVGVDPSWPIVGQSILGFVTMVDADTIEYSLASGEIIGIYRAESRRPPLCD